MKIFSADTNGMRPTLANGSVDNPAVAAEAKPVYVTVAPPPAVQNTTQTTPMLAPTAGMTIARCFVSTKSAQPAMAAGTMTLQLKWYDKSTTSHKASTAAFSLDGSLTTWEGSSISITGNDVIDAEDTLYVEVVTSNNGINQNWAQDELIVTVWLQAT